MTALRHALNRLVAAVLARVLKPRTRTRPTVGGPTPPAWAPSPWPHTDTREPPATGLLVRNPDGSIREIRES